MGHVDFLHNPLEKKMFQFLSTQSQLPQHKESGLPHTLLTVLDALSCDALRTGLHAR
jgi:hypothetical protein